MSTGMKAGTKAGTRNWRRLAVLGGLAGAGVVLLAGTRVWVRQPVAGLAGEQVVHATGRGAAPAALALALVAAAGAVVLGTAGPMVRRITAALLVLVGGLIVAAAVVVVRDPGGAVADTLADRTSVRGTSSARTAQLTPWPALALAGGVAVAAAGGIGLLRGERWSGLSGRYQGAAGSASEAPSGDGASDDAWDALSRGEDPT